MEWFGDSIYPPLNDAQIREVGGKLKHGLYLDQPIAPGQHIDFISVSTVRVGELPSAPILRMAKKVHVDNFFDHGALRLGSMKLYRGYDHEESGDKEEGKFMLVGRNQRATFFADVGGGFDYFALCMFAGEPDPICRDRFGYDAWFRVIDPLGFAKAISAQIGAELYCYGLCVYCDYKAIVAELPATYDFSFLSHEILEPFARTQYFIKPSSFAHQHEFRILWKMRGEVELFKDIECPEAVRFCERL